MEAEALIKHLNLEAHVEGGYFRRTFQADHRLKVNTPNGPRYTMTSILYMLTAKSPVGHFHKNKSDIMHVFMRGDPITYYLIHPDGRLETRILSGELKEGHTLQFVVKGGVWKASSLGNSGKFGLITEVVAPGFEYADMALADAENLSKQFPQHEKVIAKFSRQPNKPQ